MWTVKGYTLECGYLMSCMHSIVPFWITKSKKQVQTGGSIWGISDKEQGGIIIVICDSNVA
jgi:hypothetical protein